MRSFSRLVGIIAVIASFSAITQAAPTGVCWTIDSISGKLEAMSAGQTHWRPATLGTILSNNDMLRALDNSTGRLKAENGSTIYVRAGTQLRMNFYDEDPANIISRHVTVFMGAVFFIVKKSLPRALVSHDDFKVYTPTAVLAIRGTSFSVKVEPNTGATTTNVITGTVLVRNIIENSSLFVGAAYKTSVGIIAAPLAPTPIMKADIEGLKSWLPQQLIAAQLVEQSETAREEKGKVNNVDDNKTLVIPFANRSTYKGTWDIGDRMAAAVAIQLSNANSRHSAAVSGATGADPIETGILGKARFVLNGEIEIFDIAQFAEISAGATEYRELSVARIKIKVHLIDTRTRTMVYEGEIAGEVGGKNSSANTLSELASLPFSLDNPAFSASILGQAVKQTAGQSVEVLGNYLNN